MERTLLKFTEGNDRGDIHADRNQARPMRPKACHDFESGL